jgi:hypothetical protein
MAAAPETHDLRDRKLSELLQELSQQTATLARQEIELAKAELAEKGRRAGAGAGLLGAGGVVALLALGALTAAIVAALAMAVPTWLAALIVAVVYGAIAGVLALIGRRRLQEAGPPAPEQTVETVKEDVQWAKTRARSGRT